MTNKHIVFAFLVAILSSTLALGQIGNGNLVFWSATKKLTVDDFGIKVSNENSPSFAQFSVDYQVNGFDFMTKNFNKKVRNYIIVSASWIDTTSNVEESLRYQQTLFDLCEIYTRQFRKELKENRKIIASGTQFVEELNQKIMTDFANRRVVYDKETNYGLLSDKQLIWESQIQKELDELKDYAFDKK
jgi:hypothetical protein